MFRRGFLPYFVLSETADAGGAGGTDAGATSDAAATAAATSADATASASDAEAAGKTPEQLAAEQAAAGGAGAKTVPDTYTLTAPQGSSLDADDLAEVAKDAKALGLTNEQAQTLAQQRADALKAFDEANAAGMAEIKADKVLGGANYDQTLKDTTAGLNWLFGADLPKAQEFFNSFGLGNNLTLVRGIAKLGRELREDRPGGGSAIGGGGKKSTADKFYDKTPARA